MAMHSPPQSVWRARSARIWWRIFPRFATSLALQSVNLAKNKRNRVGACFSRSGKALAAVGLCVCLWLGGLASPLSPTLPRLPSASALRRPRRRLRAEPLYHRYIYSIAPVFWQRLTHRYSAAHTTHNLILTRHTHTDTRVRPESARASTPCVLCVPRSGLARTD